MVDLATEISFRTARSGGSGGQNVNKVETSAEALWHVASSEIFTEEEKTRIADKLKHRINKDGYLAVKSTDSRSQLENKHLALKKLEELVTLALYVKPERKPTKPSKEAKEKRIESKKKTAQKKENRRPPSVE